MRAPEFWSAEGGPIAGLAAGLLTPLGVAWDAASHLRRAVTRPYRAPLPVVCVGNLVVGGSGKTPVVLSLAALAAAHRVGVHIVTRGYGGRLAGPVRVDAGTHDAAAVGDEALLLAAAAPCWVARDRAAGIAAAAAAAGAAAVLLDDGFQNPGFVKDLSLLVVDADYGFGNGRRLPAGPLREPVAAGLARADALVLLGEGAAPEAVREARRPILRAWLEPANGERFAGAAVVAFAGIGRPAKFFASLRAAGASLAATHAFPDHHRFSEREIGGLRGEAARAGARLVTTAKDFVRLPEGLRAGIETLEVAVRWQDRASAAGLLFGALHRNFDGYRRSAPRG